MWFDNGDGTFTAQEGDTLWDQYGSDWNEKSGFTRDPRTLQVGEFVGKVTKQSLMGSDVSTGFKEYISLMNSQNFKFVNFDVNSNKTFQVGIGVGCWVIIGLSYEIGIAYSEKDYKD